jgi:hypothetical protein
MNRCDIEDAIKPYGFKIEQSTNGATNGHFFIMYGKIAVGMLSYGLRDYETFRASCANGFAPPVLLTPENLIPTIEIGAAYQRQQASERYFECLDMMKRLERKSDPGIAEQKQDPDNEDLVDLTLTARLPRATADAIKNGLPYRVEPIPVASSREEAIAKATRLRSEGVTILGNALSAQVAAKINPGIKPKRPAVIPRPWSEFADAGMFWFVNRLLHVFGWVICRETEPDGTISGVYPARTRYRGFSEKDESEGFRKVTADIQAHMTELVEDCES